MSDSEKIKRLISGGELLASEIEAELQVNEDNRLSQIKTADLKLMALKVNKIVSMARCEELPIKSVRNKEMTRIVMDQWTLGADLGNKIIEWENKYAEL